MERNSGLEKPVSVPVSRSTIVLGAIGDAAVTEGDEDVTRSKSEEEGVADLALVASAAVEDDKGEARG